MVTLVQTSIRSLAAAASVSATIESCEVSPVVMAS
jgi:hypothetical protein